MGVSGQKEAGWWKQDKTEEMVETEQKERGWGKQNKRVRGLGVKGTKGRTDGVDSVPKKAGIRWKQDKRGRYVV